MILLPALSGLNSGEGQNISLQPVPVTHPDGSTGTAYVSQPDTAAKQNSANKLHKHLIVVYLLVGTISLALSAYATLRLLHKKN